ncbi:MAG: FkbM family methyltransferase, partial [Acidimicrobiaceae bacterium]
GLHADQVRESFKIPFPEFIKLDVDGIEALILAGATEVLTKADSVLVEVQHSEAEKEIIYSCLIKSGLSKRQVARHNEIWTRD